MESTFSEALSQTNFTFIDWIIVGVYLSISLIIGLLVKRFATNMTSYIGAGRALGTRLGVATLAGTETGLVTVMYSSQKGFTGGFAAFHIAIMAALGTFIVGATGLIVYRLRKLKVLTIPEYYEQRFGRKTRILGAVMLALGGILNMGLFLKVGSMFIVGITGMSATGWALPTVMTVLLILVLAYTVLGGMISVVVTDYIQFVVLSIGLLFATGLIIHHLGWQNIFDTVALQMGEKGFNPVLADGTFGIEYIIWMGFLGLIACAVWPAAVARALAMESPEAVKVQYMWSSVAYLIRFLIPYFWGIATFVFIFTQAPELKLLFFPEAGGGEPIDNLYAMPIFLGRILPVGIIGVITAAMIAAFMSTHDSYLLCWSSVITQDIIVPLSRRNLSNAARIRSTRIIIVIIGAYILYWGLVYKGKDDIWDYLVVTGAVYFTGAFALLVGGLYWKRASSTGAVLALLCGFFAIFGLEPVRNAVGFDGLTGAQVGLFTIGMAFTAMIIGSLLFPDKDNLPNTNNNIV